jgi:hypothetical protein
LHACLHSQEIVTKANITENVTEKRWLDGVDDHPSKGLRLFENAVELAVGLILFENAVELAVGLYQPNSKLNSILKQSKPFLSRQTAVCRFVDKQQFVALSSCAC